MSQPTSAHGAPPHGQPSALLQAIDERTRFLDELASAGAWDHPAWKHASSAARFDPFSGKCKFAGSGNLAIQEKANDSEMSVPFVISSVSQDRDGDVLMPHGCAKWLPAYAKNPVFLFAHDPRLLPVGLARDKTGACTVKIEEERVVATCYFHDETEVARDCYRLVKAGVLGAASVGFIPHKAKRLKRPERGTAERPDVDDGTIDFDWPGFCFVEWELAEVSIVVIQSNRDAIRLSLEKGIDGRPLGQVARRAVERFAPAKVHQVIGGWTPGLSRGVEITLPRDQFPDMTACETHLRNKGLDASDYDETPTGWVFRQPASQSENSLGQFCRPSGADVNMTPTTNSSVANSNATTAIPGAEKPMSATATKAPSKRVKQIPPAIFSALGSLFDLDAGQIAEQANAVAVEAMKATDGGGDNGKPALSAGANTLASLKDICEAVLPVNEQPDVVALLTAIVADAGKTAHKAYPALAEKLGFKAAAEEDDDTDEDEDEDAGDEDDEDGDDLDEAGAKQWEDAKAAFTRITGVAV